jgi:P-type Ca2+ transporter type 2C
MVDGHVTGRDRTMTFTAFVFFDFFNALACRSDRKSVFRLGVFSNRFFNYAVGTRARCYVHRHSGLLCGERAPPLMLSWWHIGSCFLVQLAVIYVPWLQAILQTEALAVSDLLAILLLSSLVLWVDEARKWLLRRAERRGTATLFV